MQTHEYTEIILSANFEALRIRQVVGHKSILWRRGPEGENIGEEDLIQTRLGASREHTVVSVGGTWSIYASGIGGKCLVCGDVEYPTKITSRIALRLQKPHDTPRLPSLRVEALKGHM